MKEKIKEEEIIAPDGLVSIEQEIPPDLYQEAEEILAEQEEDFDQKIKDILEKKNK